MAFDTFSHEETRYDANGKFIPIDPRPIGKLGSGWASYHDTGYTEIRWDREAGAWHEYGVTERTWGHDVEGDREEEDLG